MKTLYFVEPFGKTNEAIVDLVGPQNTESHEQRDVLCADGERRNLWELSVRQVEQLISRVNVLRLHFNVFRKVRGGKVRFIRRCEPQKEDAQAERKPVPVPLAGQVICSSQSIDKDPLPF